MTFKKNFKFLIYNNISEKLKCYSDHVPTKRAENLPISCGGAQAPIMGNMAAGKPDDYNNY